MSDRPPEGSRWIVAAGSRTQALVVLAPDEDRFDMVAARMTRSYTTRDQFDWPVRHPKGEKTLIPPENFRTRLEPDDESARAFLASAASSPESRG